MTTSHASQLTLNLEPGLADRWGTLREYLAYRVTVQAKPAKTIAAEMDIAPSTLSRKLHPQDGDSQRFNIDDLERYLAATGDAAAVIEWLAARYLNGGDAGRKARAIANVEALSAELSRALTALKESA